MLGSGFYRILSLTNGYNPNKGSIIRLLSEWINVNFALQNCYSFSLFRNMMKWNNNGVISSLNVGLIWLLPLNLILKSSRAFLKYVMIWHFKHGYLIFDSKLLFLLKYRIFIWIIFHMMWNQFFQWYWR